MAKLQRQLSDIPAARMRETMDNIDEDEDNDENDDNDDDKNAEDHSLERVPSHGIGQRKEDFSSEDSLYGLISRQKGILVLNGYGSKTQYSEEAVAHLKDPSTNEGGKLDKICRYMDRVYGILPLPLRLLEMHCYIVFMKIELTWFLVQVRDNGS